MELKSGFVSIIGRPNSGKSTLLNRVLDYELSITSAKPQTTRQRVIGVLNKKNTGQIVFFDTPGLHMAREGGINAFMVREAIESLKQVTLAWMLIDIQSSLKAQANIFGQLEGFNRPVFYIFNKMDLTKESSEEKPSENPAKYPGKNPGEGPGKSPKKIELELQARFGFQLKPRDRSFCISALSGKGTDELISETWQYLSPGLPFFSDPDQVSNMPMRFFVSEWIRREIFELLDDEVPYSCGVWIEHFTEAVSITRIEAKIFVEKESQKAIVIGSGGSMIKAIGTGARKSIEKILGQKVFLGLQVKTLKNWTRNPDQLRKLGYTV